jgi:GT2 family glycosyltransferase
MSRQDAGTPEEQLKAAERRIRELEVELQATHTRLQQITTGRYWAIVSFLQGFCSIFAAPASQRGEKARELSRRVLRKVGLGALARRIGGDTSPSAVSGAETQAAGHSFAADGPHGCDVICLPRIAWDSQAQRLQPRMEQCANREHRVFYASLGFCKGKTAHVERYQRNLFGMTLPGPSNIDVHRDSLSDRDMARMAAAIDRLRVEAGLTATAIVVEHPFWATLAKKLQERFGWPIIDDCRDDRAAKNTGSKHCDDFESVLRESFPPASIIIVTYNNLGLTQMCLESLFRETDYPNYEVIVIDNASHDGTPEWLVEQAATEPRLRVICNADNRGFAGANNQALRIARGKFLCLLNNDTVVTRGWLSTLIGHLRKSPTTGMVGPVSNMVGNKAKIPVDYESIEEMPHWAADYCRRHDGQTMPMQMLGFFCVVCRRDLYEKVGDLDEQFGVGYFEDTDYCHRIRCQGFELRCARDAFVHHWQSASFRQLGQERHAHIFQQNRRLFEAKWGADSMAGAY